jgi:prepilin-type N-terminal cleavage/methylation domain-containing protein
MNHRSSGFTLIEVLIALGILVSSVFVLSNLQIRLLFRVLKDRERIEKTFLIKNDLYKAFLKPPDQGKPMVTKYEHDALSITSERLEIAKNSALIEPKDQLSILKTYGNWVGDAGQKGSLDMMTILVKKIEKNKKKSV